MKISLIMLCSAALLVGGCTPKNAPRVSKLSANEKRVEEIVAQMTLEEKVAMLHGKHMFTSEGVPRLGIADMIYADGPFGIREEMEPHSWNSIGWTNDRSTFFPTGSALAATWSEELAYSYGTGMAREARLRGKDMILGPAINIQRLPTGGRTYEYFSEDPFLSSRLSVGYTLGVQDNGVAACLKHYALNNQENNRGNVDVIVSPRVMREIYLPAFEAAVTEGDAYGVMAAYNKVNGLWCSENGVLQNDILRGEWGFKGMIISDWGGTHSTVGAALGGLDVEMPGERYFGEALLDSVRSGAVPEGVIDEKVKNILRVRLAIEPIPAEKANVELTAKPEQAQIAYDVAVKSIVLLKNEDGLLPLNLENHPKIAVIGSNAVQTMGLGGVGAGVKAFKEVTPLQGLTEKIGDRAEIVYAEGYTNFGPQQMFTRQSPYGDADPKLLAEAVEVAREAYIVLFVAGNNRWVETEGSDRVAITLPSGQDQLAQALAAVNPNIVTVLVTGAPVDLRVVEPLSPTIVVSWLNGSEGGTALADVLTGKVAPSGKLPFTFPVKLEDSPAYALGNYPQTGEVGSDVFVDLVNNASGSSVQDASDRDKAYYSEGLLVGYRWFDTKQIAPQYPFGHGLSYTTFDYANLVTDKAKYRADDEIKVTIEVTNSGSRAAEEVVQLYVERIGATVEWPAKELKAFGRVALQVGETKTVTLGIPVQSLRYWDEVAGDWALEHSGIRLLVGSSSRDIRVEGDVTI
ncbi:MAG: glycoside hydrolase family 3 C-terminal domain-containing protein [Rikenellaceae bacterium]|jgi:beta-glucosidase|nr:glycoside hydrolase family 3 C-terminal domain-containing protein [Rikenellaceae bacterium]